MSTEYEGHRNRIKKRFLNEGLKSFEPHNVLELLLCYTIPRVDTKQLARTLIKTFGSFGAVLDADYNSLIRVEGVGDNTATFLKLLPETFRYYEVEKSRVGFVANSTDAAMKFAKAYYIGETNELCYLLCFNSKLKLINCVKVSEGSFNAAGISLRRVVEIATIHKAASVILMHNHPGGTAIPSKEDIETTNKIYKALKVIGIELNDHIIAADSECISMANEGIIQNI